MLAANGTELGALVGAGAIVGLIIGWMAGLLSTSRRHMRDRLAEQHRIATLEETARLQKEKINDQRQQLADESARGRALQERVEALKSHRAELAVLIKKERSTAAEKIGQLQDLKASLKDLYQSIAAGALRDNSRAFMDLADTTFAKYMQSAKQDMENRNTAVAGMVKPLAASLERYEAQALALEQSRQNAYGDLNQQVGSLLKAQTQLQKETGRLAQALRVPHVRGRWGELTLKRAAELAGMANRCDFLEQPSTTGREGTVRPDMIVHLPGDRRVAVDAKVSLEAYLNALDAENEQQRDQYLDQHAQQVLNHIHQLAQKGYWQHVTPSPEFVVMFIPGENFFSSALTSKPKLLEIGAAKGVILATPATLIALLKSVAVGWRQVETAENARRISELGQLLYQRLGVMVDHMGRTGKNIDRCVTAFNAMVGSFENRVLVAARQFEKLGLADGGMHKLDTPDKIERNLRSGLDTAGRTENQGAV